MAQCSDTISAEGFKQIRGSTLDFLIRINFLPTFAGILLHSFLGRQPDEDKFERNNSENIFFYKSL